MAIENRFASENYVSEVLESYVQTDDLNDYAKLNDLNDYAKLNDLNDYSKLSDLNDYAKLDVLNDYATTEYVDSEVERVLSLTERVKSWGAVQYYVRNGQAPYIFNIGDQLICNSKQFGELVWDIIGFDQDTPTDSQYTHSMTLQLHNVLDMVPREFDAQEALYKTESELTAGIYYLGYQSKIDGSGTEAYYNFTIPEGTTIPANAILYGVLSSSVSFISDYSQAETYWTGTCSYGKPSDESATYLGLMNYHRANSATAGFNNYKQSSIRFFLNGENETLTEWIPQHPLDMPPSYINSPGFLYQIDEDFRNVIGSVNKEVINTSEGMIEEISDLIFLPSSTEIFSTSPYLPSGEQVDIGSVYEYYSLYSGLEAPNASANDSRIKYNSENTATPYYLRTPMWNSATAATQSATLMRVHAVSNAGAITGGNVGATGTGTVRYLAPCCCVI